VVETELRNQQCGNQKPFFRAFDAIVIFEIFHN